MQLLNEQKRVWAKIDINKLEHNLDLIKCPICCVVKANAYGHGAVPVSKVCAKKGVQFFAVSNIEEALQLRRGGIVSSILILGYTPVDCVELLEQYDLQQTVYNYEYACLLNDRCISSGIRIKVHLKVDTGMGRIGFQFHDNVNELGSAMRVCLFEGFRIVGLFTHFASADEGVNEFTIKQHYYFTKAIEIFKSNGICFDVVHCSNSAAAIDYPSFKMDMIRYGIALYGINPTKNRTLNFEPVLSLWSIVSNVKTIRKGDSVSYGRLFIAERNTKIATIPIGYGDGFWRSNSGHFVYINNKKCKIVGRVCMDQIMVECENARLGDLVEIYGDHITIDQVASYNHTIPYEILCSLSDRVPRVYVKDGDIVDVIDKFCGWF